MTAFDPGSFRDPAGHVVRQGDRVFRVVAPERAEETRAVLEAPFFKRRTGTSIVPTWIASARDRVSVTSGIEGNFPLVLEHERIEVVSYPFEWPFSLLKRAAELHLEIHLEALEDGFDLSDSSAYNVQFAGTRPQFIDILSFRRYREGAYWAGYKQFCEEFLAPLLLTACRGVPFNDWYRGGLSGLDLVSLSKLLPLRSRFSLQAQMHVFMHARLMRRIRSHEGGAAVKQGKLPLASLKGILRGMLSFVRSLQPRGLESTYWKDYELNNSYLPEDAERKRAAVRAFIEREKPDLLVDVGCNSGDFSELSVAAGAGSSVGVDFDQGALEAAVSRADEHGLPLLPLYQDLTNPSASQGWAASERGGFVERVRPDAVVALAVLHHLIIGKNIPFFAAIKWLVDLAPKGLLEFVPKSDPMVQGMLAHRGDIFPHYTETNFRESLSRLARITSEVQSSASGRRVFTYER
ncbi:class I SAM-dependent methyltransferase [Pelagibius marinus]|uniref:class I SAM-dependent methyltransferase n=1 Tax=Pelagibius marinus TaxID=2762760 RepID=UPI0018727A24|nr:class I SAM-dependent methyltransferase [Pelagibius marinus]